MGRHRKSIFDAILVETLIFSVVVEIRCIQTAEPMLKSQVNPIVIGGDHANTRPTLVPQDPKLFEDFMNGGGDDTLNKLNSDQNQKDQDKKETDFTNKKKEDFSVFASFLVEIIVFFVFLAILLSFITICARKCGGNPANSGRIYGPGPVMGGLITDREDDLGHGQGQGGFPHNMLGVTTNAGGIYRQYGEQGLPRMSVAQSEYSEYNCEGELQKPKRPKKKKIPGPTF